MTSPPNPHHRDDQTLPVSGQSRSGRRITLLAAVLILAGVANNAQSLRWGFLYDDYFHQFTLHGLAEGSRLRCWSLYDFTPDAACEQSPSPQRMHIWWADPDFKVRFFRPVASLSILLDSVLYGDWAPGYHLSGLILFAVLLTLTFKLYRELGAPPTAALWALAFFALDDIHSLPVGWIANRNTLLATLFVVAAVLGVHHHRRSGKRRYLLLALACFLLAVGSKESGIVALPLVALYLLLFDQPSAGESARDSVRRLLRSPPLWAFTLLAAAYVAFYLGSGHGARSAGYPTPWGEPGQYLARLAVLLPVGLQSLLFGFVSDILLSRPGWTMAVVVGAVPVLAVAGLILLRVVKWTPLSAFALGWALLALLPEGGADVSDRLLMSASLGTALLVGLFFDRLRPVRVQIAARRYARLVLAAVLLLSGLIAGVPMTIVRSSAFVQLAGRDRSTILDADIDRTTGRPRRVFLLNSPSSLLALTFLPTWSVTYEDRETQVLPLQMGRRPLTWQRVDERTMILTSNAGPFLDHTHERLFRVTRAAPVAGTRYETPEFTAVALAVEPTGLRSVQFRFNRSLDDPSYRFLGWQAGRLVRVAAPPVGGIVELPAVPATTAFAP